MTEGQYNFTFKPGEPIYMYITPLPPKKKTNKQKNTQISTTTKHSIMPKELL